MGKLIVIEGTDGSGKSTQFRLLTQRLERTEENKCICREFREQIADPEFKGYCHCMLYYKD